MTADVGTGSLLFRATTRPVSSESTSFRVDVQRTIAGHGALWPRAGATADARCHAFQTVEFLETWQDSYGRATRAEPLFVCVSERDGSPLLLLPLAITRRGGARELSFIDATASDYNAPVLFPTNRTWTRETAAALWAEITAALPPFDILSLIKLPPDVGGIVNPLYLIAGEENPESCHGTNLDRPWEAIEGALVGLRTLRKSTRALERIAPVRLEVAETPEARQRMLATLLAQKQRRFEDTRVPGFDEHPEKSAFFEKAGEPFAKSGSLHFCGLFVGVEIIASAWGLIHAGSYYGLMIGSDRDKWAQYSPGRILYHKLMHTLRERGCTYLDSGIGNEPWKLANCDNEVPLRMHIQGATWRGQVFLAQRRLLENLRGSRWWQRARPYKWVVLRHIRRIYDVRGMASQADR